MPPNWVPVVKMPTTSMAVSFTENVLPTLRPFPSARLSPSTATLASASSLLNVLPATNSGSVTPVVVKEPGLSVPVTKTGKVKSWLANRPPCGWMADCSPSPVYCSVSVRDMPNTCSIVSSWSMSASTNPLATSSAPASLSAFWPCGPPPPKPPPKNPPPKLPAGVTVTPLPTWPLISSSLSPNAALTVIMISVSPTLTASTATSRPVRSGLRTIVRKPRMIVLTLYLRLGSPPPAYYLRLRGGVSKL